MVDSPCIGVCALNSAAVCVGCGRHLDEIAAWSKLGDAAKRLIVGRASARMQQLRASGEAREKTA